jgi:hypothetical protein
MLAEAVAVPVQVPGNFAAVATNPLIKVCSIPATPIVPVETRWP